MSNNLRISLLIVMIVNAVVFGIGAVAILSVPSWNQQAKYLLPAWIAASFLIAPVIAWVLAPRMRSRIYHQRKAAQRYAAE